MFDEYATYHNIRSYVLFKSKSLSLSLILGNLNLTYNMSVSLGYWTLKFLIYTP